MPGCHSKEYTFCASFSHVQKYLISIALERCRLMVFVAIPTAVLSAYATGTNFRSVKICGGVSALRIVIALSACWLINRALALVPPPSILYGGMTITGPSLVLTLVDLRVARAGLLSGRINAGATR